MENKIRQRTQYEEFLPSNGDNNRIVNVHITEVNDAGVCSVTCDDLDISSIRLIGCNAPVVKSNSNDNYMRAQSYSRNRGLILNELYKFGEEAKLFLKRLLSIGTITADLYVNNDGEIPVLNTDSEGRPLAVLYRTDTSGRIININKTLVASGAVDVDTSVGGHIDVSDWSILSPPSRLIQFSAYTGENVDNTTGGESHDNTTGGESHDNTTGGEGHDNTTGGESHDNTPSTPPSEDEDWEVDTKGGVEIEPRVGYMPNMIIIDTEDNERIDPADRPDGYLQIGDVEFILPPQAITVTRQMKNEKTPLLRGSGSIQAKSGYSDIVIEVELFFHDKDSINGYTISGAVGDSNYYINGLRPLIAQFKKAPFVPIINNYINGVHHIESVALANIMSQTVPGFPDCISVILVMYKFDHQAFLPYTDSFYDCFNWPLFRWYCQAPLRYGGKTYLKPVSGTNTFQFYLANEDALRILKDNIEEMSGYTTPLTYNDENTNTAFGQIRVDSINMSTALAQQERYNKLKAQGKKRILPNDIVGEKGSTWNDLLFFAPDIVYSGGAGFVNIPPDFSDGPYFGIMIMAEENNQLLINNNISCIAEVAGQAGSGVSTKVFRIPANRTDLTGAIIDKGKAQDKIIDKTIEEYKTERARQEGQELELKLDSYEINDLIVKSISVNLENIFSPMQISNSESPTYQYLGSQDTYIQVKLETISEETVERLVNLARTAERYSRDYRIGIVAGFLEIENDFINLFGIKSILIEDLVVNTVSGFPGRFEISMMLVGFNKTQRRISTPYPMRNGDSYKTISDVITGYEEKEEIVELKLLELELYPDLELPTLIEVKQFCKEAGIDFKYNMDEDSPDDPSTEVHGFNAPRFVDPDFYISTPYTFRKSLKDMINIEKAAADEGISGYVNSDYVGDAWVRVPGKNDKDPRPLYNVATKLDEWAKEKWEIDKQLSQQHAYGIGAGGAQGASGVGSGVSAGAPGGTVSEESGVINKTSLSVRPSLDEWMQWTGINNPNIAQSDYDARCGVNPSQEQIVTTLVSYIRKLFGEEDNETVTQAIKYAKSMLSTETRTWSQFVDGLPNFGRDLDTGLGQYIPTEHGMTFGQARRLAWDWEYNLWMSLTYFRSMYVSVINDVAPYNSDPFRWALLAYNRGSVRGDGYTNPIQCPYISGNECIDYWYTTLYRDADIMTTPNNRTSASTVQVANSYSQATRKYIEGSLAQANKLDSMVLAKTDSRTDGWNDVGASMPKNDDVRQSDWNLEAWNKWWEKHQDGSWDNWLGKIGNNTFSADKINSDKTYSALVDTNEKVRYNKHEPVPDLTRLWADSFIDMLGSDQRGRLIRAFPTFQMFLIDEGRWVSWVKMWDNFYGFNAIQSIDVIRSRKIAADTCVINMTNVYNNLTRYETDIEHHGYDTKYSWVESLFKKFDHQALVDARKEYISTLFLKTGARIHLRMGYSACAADLPIVFNGTITELEVGKQVIQIIAQGDGIELQNAIGGEPDKINDGVYGREARSTLCYLMTRHNNPFWEWIDARMNEKVVKRAEDEKEREEAKDEEGVLKPTYSGEKIDFKAWWKNLIDRKENPLGVVHFGNPYQVPQGFKWPWSDENDRLGEVAVNIYTSTGHGTHTGQGTHSEWLHDPYSFGVQYGNVQPETYQDWHTKWGFIPWPDGDEPNIVLPLFGKTIWEIAQTLALCSPDYVATVLPFQFRSTLFYGRPYWPYYYKYKWIYNWDKSTKSWRKTAKHLYGKPMSQTHLYFDYTDIISNGIKASEEGIYTNVIATYMDKAGKPISTTVVHADTDIYPEKQKTIVTPINIIETSWGLKNGGTNAARFANTAAAQTLRDYMKDMYKGDLVVMGDPSVKPYDMFYIHDEVNYMNGIAGIKQVVHHFSHETGFVTNISPDAVVIVDDKLYTTFVNYQASVCTGVAATAIGQWTAVAAWRKFTGSSLGMAARSGVKALGEIAMQGLSKFVANNPYNSAIIEDFMKIVDTDGWKKAFEWLKRPPSPHKISYVGRSGEILKLAENLKKVYDVAKTTKYVGIAVRSVVGLSRLLFSATGVGLIATTALTMLSESLFEAYARKKRNMQAVLIIPLTSYGKPLVAGINGHQGCVLGDKPSKMDLFWAGKGEGALSWIPKALDAISGTDDGNLYQWNEDEPPTIVSGKVVDTIDGDTIDVEIDGKVERVRLIGVDTPETVDPDRPVGYFGPEASNYTKTRLLGKTITIEVGLNDRDVYDRLLGYVFIGSNMFNEELLRGGYGKIMIIAPNDKYENIFEAAEEVARENKLGVWGEE